jgi:hypothetical protein
VDAEPAEAEASDAVSMVAAAVTANTAVRRVDEFTGSSQPVAASPIKVVSTEFRECSPVSGFGHGVA